MKVLKFGGTSLGSPEKMKSIYSILQAQKNNQTIIVLSAISGTTDQLVNISSALLNHKREKITKLLEGLKNFYNDYINDLLKQTKYQKAALKHLQYFIDNICNCSNLQHPEKQEKNILAQGELLSTQLFYLYLKEQKEDPKLLPALEMIKVDKNDSPDFDFLQKKLQQYISDYSQNTIFITQGFICRDISGGISNLKRGGSDYTASLVGAAIQAEEIQIWTDIDGVHNNDPRCVNHTNPINFLSFDEAAELAYFGAKILHPQCILPAKKTGIPVRLLNTMAPKKTGTLISHKSISKGKIVALAAKDNITAIRIQSSRMLLAYGFLRQIFEVFELYKTSIDMISTSEVAVSLTIDNTKNLEAIKKALQPYGTIQIETNQSILCAVGDFGMDTHNGHVLKIAKALKHLPIRMISYGGSAHNISLLLPQTYKTEALQALHSHLF